VTRSDGSAPRRERWVVAGIAQRRAKGGGMLNRHGEEERGRGGGGRPGGQTSLPGPAQGNGPGGQWAGEEKGIKI
jgi:hypothetical protein